MHSSFMKAFSTKSWFSYSEVGLNVCVCVCVRTDHCTHNFMHILQIAGKFGQIKLQKLPFVILHNTAIYSYLLSNECGCKQTNRRLWKMPRAKSIRTKIFQKPKLKRLKMIQVVIQMFELWPNVIYFPINCNHGVWFDSFVWKWKGWTQAVAMKCDDK